MFNTVWTSNINDIEPRMNWWSDILSTETKRSGLFKFFADHEIKRISKWRAWTREIKNITQINVIFLSILKYTYHYLLTTTEPF